MEKQAMPNPGQENVTELLISHIRTRAAKGLQEYGRPLETHNGRDALQDLLEELLDASQYVMQAMAERGSTAGAGNGDVIGLALTLHRHTEECLWYAAFTGKAYCISPCADSRRLLRALTKGEEPQNQTEVQEADGPVWRLNAFEQILEALAELVALKEKALEQMPEQREMIEEQMADIRRKMRLMAHANQWIAHRDFSVEDLVEVVMPRLGIK